MGRPTSIVLHQFTDCPYCAKVRATMDELDLEYELVNHSRADRESVAALGSETVPVIQDAYSDEQLPPHGGMAVVKDGVLSMNESGDIIAYLRARYA